MFLSDEAIDRCLSRHRPLMAAGGLLLAAGWLCHWLTGVPAGLASGVMLLWLGATCGALGSYRVERGLWMLAALWAVPSAAMWAVFARYSFVATGLWPLRPASVAWAVDTAAATALLGQVARLCASVARSNWRRFGGTPK